MTLKINTMDSLENKNLSREGIIVRLAELNLQEEPVERTELDSLKQNFYKLRIAEVETARKAFEEANGTTEGFVPEKDEYEERFKEIMSAIREKRNALKEEEEQEKLANLEKKKAIIERMKELSEAPEEANKSYQEFKQLQTEWNEIKNLLCLLRRIYRRG